MSAIQPVVHLQNTASFFAVLHNAVQNGATVGYTAVPAAGYDASLAPPLLVDDAPIRVGEDQRLWLAVNGAQISIPTVDVIYQEVRVRQGEYRYRYVCDFNVAVQEMDKEEWDRLHSELQAIEKGSQTGFAELLAKFNQQLASTLQEKDAADRKRFEAGHSERELLMNALVGHQTTCDDGFQRMDLSIADLAAKLTSTYELLGLVHRQTVQAREAAREEHQESVSRFAPLSATLQRVEGKLDAGMRQRESSPPVVVLPAAAIPASVEQPTVSPLVGRRETSLCRLPSKEPEQWDSSMADFSTRNSVVADYVNRKASVLLCSHAMEIVDSVISASAGRKDSILRLLPVFFFPGQYTRKGEKASKPSWDMMRVAADSVWDAWVSLCREPVGRAKELLRRLKERKIALELDEALLLQGVIRGSRLSDDDLFRAALLHLLIRGTTSEGAFEYRFFRIALAVHKDTSVAEFNALLGGGTGTITTPGERSEVDMLILPRGN